MSRTPGQKHLRPVPGPPAPTRLSPVLWKAPYITALPRCPLPGVPEHRAAEQAGLRSISKDSGVGAGAGELLGSVPLAFTRLGGRDVCKHTPTHPHILGSTQCLPKLISQDKRGPGCQARTHDLSFACGSDSLCFATGSKPTRVITCFLAYSGAWNWGRRAGLAQPGVWLP